MLQFFGFEKYLAFVGEVGDNSYLAINKSSSVSFRYPPQKNPLRDSKTAFCYIILVFFSFVNCFCAIFRIFIIFFRIFFMSAFSPNLSSLKRFAAPPLVFPFGQASPVS